MKLSEDCGTWLHLLALSIYAFTTSICTAIRYGFLADAFSCKGVNGRISGAVETSIFAGFFVTYISQSAEGLMTRFNSKYIIMANTLGFSVIAIITGLSYQIDDINTFIVISLVMRILQGFLVYTSNILPYDYLNANFAKDFELTSALVNVGFFTGIGVTEPIGCVLYDQFGYGVAYGFSACVALMTMLLICIVLPNNKTHLATQADIDNRISDTDERSYGSQALSKLLIPIVVAAMLCNANYSFIQVSVTPFLKEQFNKSLSYGGTVLIFVSLGTTIGSFSVGTLLQKKIMSHFTIMAIGAFCIFVGLVMTFPSNRFSGIYNLAPVLAYPGVFIAGFGDPFTTIATLNALYYIQRRIKGEMQPKTSTKINGIWLITYCSMYYLGPFIGGALTEYLSYTTTAKILAGICLFAMAICLWLRFHFQEPELEQGDDEEKEHLMK